MLPPTSNPRIVVLSGGVDHPSYVEQSYLATRLGLNLAEGADLVVRQRRVWLRSLAGLEPVDVLFRRLEDDRVGSDGGQRRRERRRPRAAAGCSVTRCEPRQRARMRCAGGSGARRVLGLRRRLAHGPQIRTTRARGRCRSCRPRNAPTRNGRRLPCFDGFSTVDRAVALRLHLVASDKGIDVLQGGSARVLADGDDPMRPTLATAKDVWVIGGTVAPAGDPPSGPASAGRPDRVGSDTRGGGAVLGGSGDGTCRAHCSCDGGGARSHERPRRLRGGRTVGRARTRHVVGARRCDDTASTRRRPDRAGATFALAVEALADQLGIVPRRGIIGARVLLGDRQGGCSLGSPSPERNFDGSSASDGSSSSVVDIARIDGRHLESILVDLASLVGLWNESVVHGPAWRFGEVGRRLERAFGVIDGVRGAFGLYEGGERALVSSPFGPDHGADDGADEYADHRLDFQRQRLVEIVLASNESLVAYRRRHRSDVEFETALHLLVAEVHNPRAAASAIRGVRHQADRLGWQFGVETASALLASLESASFDSIEATVDRARGGLRRL